jgi:hypothetical protein
MLFKDAFEAKKESYPTGVVQCKQILNKTEIIFYIIGAEVCLAKYIKSNHNTTQEINVCFQETLPNAHEEYKYISIVATKDITVGQELFANYGDSYTFSIFYNNFSDGNRGKGVIIPVAKAVEIAYDLDENIDSNCVVNVIESPVNQVNTIDLTKSTVTSEDMQQDDAVSKNQSQTTISNYIF